MRAADACTLSRTRLRGQSCPRRSRVRDAVACPRLRPTRGSRVREEVSLSVSQNVAVCLPEPGVLGDEGAGAGAGGEEKEEEKEEVLCAGQRRMS